uniref:Uncharacterized protein n=1 Tax=Anguilla anguilla TaxID=7936 RepID=A0A0E9QDG4_ANGAN
MFAVVDESTDDTDNYAFACFISFYYCCTVLDGSRKS